MKKRPNILWLTSDQQRFDTFTRWAMLILIRLIWTNFAVKA